MTKSPARKAAAEKARSKYRKTARKVGTGKAHGSDRKIASKVVAEKARGTYRKTAARLEEFAYDAQIGGARGMSEVRRLNERYEAYLRAGQVCLEARGYQVSR